MITTVSILEDLITLFVDKSSHCKLSGPISFFREPEYVILTTFVMIWVDYFTNDRINSESWIPVPPCRDLTFGWEGG